MNPQIWSVFGAHPPLNVEAGGGGGGGGIHVVGGGFVTRFIDSRIFGFNEIHRPHPGPQENMQLVGVRCAISQIWPKFREMLGENPADIHL